MRHNPAVERTCAKSTQAAHFYVKRHANALAVILSHPMPFAIADTPVSHLARGAELALENAEDLFREASVLFACKAYSRVLFLHQISMEECGKIEILGGWATSQLMGHEVNLKKIATALASHKAKNFANAYMLPVSDGEQIARDTADWTTALETFREQQEEFHKQSNDKKNAALYVDFSADTFRAPRDCITEDMCHEIAARNAEFLDLVRPKVRMLSRWAENQEDTKATLLYFQTRLKELRTEYPSDPQGALDVVMNEILAKAKEQLNTKQASSEK